MKHLTFVACTATLITLISCNNKSYEYPFRNPRLTVDERVENLPSLLTPEEKVGLMMNGSISVDRLGIPAYNWWNEACHGICYDDVTVFHAGALAATFDAEQQYEITLPCPMKHVPSGIQQTIMNSAKQKPREASGTRACLSGVPTSTFSVTRGGVAARKQVVKTLIWQVLSGCFSTVKGMQGNDKDYFKTHACVNAVHSGPEPLRHRFDVSVSMRDLWETYLPAFKEIVQVGNVQGSHVCIQQV